MTVRESTQKSISNLYWLVTVKQGGTNLPTEHHLTVERHHRAGGQLQWGVLVQLVLSRQTLIVRMIPKVKSEGAMQLQSNYKRISRWGNMRDFIIHNALCSLLLCVKLINFLFVSLRFIEQRIDCCCSVLVSQANLRS